MADFRKGLRLPDQTKYIKGILEQYPDDGQILKELIQNADDAGASTVKFVLDKRQHSTNTDGLIHPDLKQFQGPALLAYNDAVFTKEDWNAICMMQESIKRDNVIKTGRFGLGFKSIFHVTDLPVILSGDYVGVIDPHKVYLPNQSSSWNWHLETEKDFIKSRENQFEPLYHNLFKSGPNVLKENSFYEHTIFRFPLRQKASLLSDTCYSPDKVEQLFQSLTVDEGKSLLFLKNIHRIEVYQYSEGAEEPELMHSMRIAGDLANEVIENRKVFCKNVQQGSWKVAPLETILHMEIEVESVRSSQKSVSKSDYLVYHRCYGGEQVQEVAEELKVLPWIGIAFPLNRSEQTSTDPKGQLFATLPLPLDGTERTGLPFHIHADFAMEQNRRHLRWPTKDQKGQRLQTSSLIWNQLLVNECIPAAVLVFFNKGLHTLTPNDLYYMLPDEDIVDTKWKPLVSHIYKDLCKGACLYSHSNGGSWVKPEESFWTTGIHSARLHELLEEILIKAGFPIVQPPEHIRRAIEKYSLAQPKTVSTSHIQNGLIKVTEEETLQLDHSSTLQVLEYFLKNGQPTDLLGLPILPLLSGKMAIFKKCNETAPIFMVSDDHPPSLLPGLEHRTVATNLGEELQGHLLKIGHKGSTQIKPISFKDVLLNIPEVLPRSWLDDDVVNWSPEEDSKHPTRAWMEQIWDYIGYNRPRAKDWPLLEKVHLLPINNGTQLCRFAVGERIILRQKGNNELPSSVCSFLCKVGMIVLSDTPEFVSRNMQLVHHFVHEPSCEGLVDALMALNQRISQKKLVEKIKLIWLNDYMFLKGFVSYISDSGINLLPKKKKVPTATLR